jgi:general stress protein YciG
MPRGENEAFKKQIGRFAANRDEARAAGRKGGKASTMTMQDFKRIANELDSEPIGDGNEMVKGEALLRNIQNEAAHGNVKAAKLWMEIKQFGEPKNIDITSGGERLPDIRLVLPEGMERLPRSEDEING